MTHDHGQVRDLATALARVYPLKALPRAGWLRVGVESPESVASHSWGVAWLVLVLCPDDVDRGHALALATIHDVPEVLAGDITPHDGIGPADKVHRETSALRDLLRDLPGSAQIAALWHEYEAGETAAARFVKACDKLDMALQAEVYRSTQGVHTAEFIASALQRLPAGLLHQLTQAIRID